MADALHHHYRHNRLLAGLPPDALAVLERDLRLVSVDRGTVIYEPGVPLETIYFPLSGLISQAIITGEGNVIEIASIGREGALGLHCVFGRRNAFTRACVNIGGAFATIRASRLGQIANASAPVRDMMSRYNENLLADAQQLAACNAVHDAASRFCRSLLQSADRIGSDNLPLTQEFLAQILGVRRTTVTPVAQALKEKGIIKYRRGQIAIADRKRLEEHACECYHVMNERKLALTPNVKS